LRGHRRKTKADQDVEPRSGAFPETCRKKRGHTPVVVTRESVLRDLQRIQRNAEADGAHPSAIRSVELKARYALPEAKAGTVGRTEQVAGRASAVTETRPVR